MNDEHLLKLARVTRVEAHKRRGLNGQTEHVDSYLRKILDKFGIGASEKTKKGAFDSAQRAQGIPTREVDRDDEIDADIAQAKRNQANAEIKADYDEATRRFDADVAKFAQTPAGKDAVTRAQREAEDYDDDYAVAEMTKDYLVSAHQRAGHKGIQEHYSDVLDEKKRRTAPARLSDIQSESALDRVIRLTAGE